MLRGRTALVSGASGDLGREFVRLFAADGFDVALVGRTGAALEELAQEVEARHGVTGHVLPIDLRRPHGPALAIGELATRGVGVDALVHCAGADLAAFASLTEHVAPGMVRRGWGRIAIASSPVAALRLSRRLAEELRDTGVRVTALCVPPAGGRREGPSAAELAAWGYRAVRRGRPYAVRGAAWRAFAIGTLRSSAPAATSLLGRA